MISVPVAWRSISWKASARSEDLLVKEFTVEGLRRCTVLLDSAARAYADRAGFERAVTVAASIVNSADRAGLTTRFVSNGDIDLQNTLSGGDAVITAGGSVTGAGGSAMASACRLFL